MQVNVPVNLVISSKVKDKNKKKIIAGIEQFMSLVPNIFAEHKKRTHRASVAMAPVRRGLLQKSIKLYETGENQFGLSVSPEKYEEELTGKNIVKTYTIRGVAANGKKIIIKKHKRKDLIAGNPVRGIMQEFGYPYRHPVFKGPYNPNPKGPKIKGLGYLRVAYIVAARSLNASSITYSKTRLDKNAVANYVKSTENEFSLAISKILANYLRGGSLPSYLKRKSVKKVARTVDLGSVKSYGSVTGLNLRIPINIQNTPEYDNMRVGDNLRNATASLNNKPFAKNASFLTDNSNFD